MLYPPMIIQRSQDHELGDCHFYHYLKILIFMDNKNLFKYIKTPCGQSKYIELQSNKSLLGKLRLFWFVIIASIKDWNISD